jgi:hypothetical protein
MHIRKRNWIRNWILKRAVLGFAVTALVVPAAAQARIDEGINGEPNSAAEVAKADGFVQGVTDFPSYPSTVSSDVPTGMTREQLNGYLLARDSVEVVRTHPRSNARDYDLIENRRGEPRTVSTPQVVSAPGFDWDDAGIGAGVAIGLVLLGGAALRASRHLGKPQTA